MKNDTAKNILNSQGEDYIIKMNDDNCKGSLPFVKCQQDQIFL